MDELNYLVKERKCIVCGKIFVPPFADLWTYRVGDKWFCRYNCRREWEKKQGKVSKDDIVHRGRKKSEDPKIDKVLRLLEAGYTVEQVAKKTGVSRQLVYYYRRSRK